MDLTNEVIPETANPKQEEDPTSTAKQSKMYDEHPNKNRVFKQKHKELIIDDLAVEKLLGPEAIPKIEIEEQYVKADLEKKLIERYKCTMCSSFPYKALECKKC